MIDVVRYWLGLLFLMFWPAALVVWFAIHPNAEFWRRAGPAAAYAVAVGAGLALAAVIFGFRDRLLAVDFGAQIWLLAAGTALLLVAQALDLWVRRTLRLRILIGLPELSSDRSQDKLLTEGPFALVRHPRYTVLALGLFGIALFANYLAVYVLAALTPPLIYVLAVVEERELVRRFGPAYEAYAARTPRFIPKLAGRR